MNDGLIVYIIRNVIDQRPKGLSVGHHSKVFKRVGIVNDIDKVSVGIQSVIFINLNTAVRTMIVSAVSLEKNHGLQCEVLPVHPRPGSRPSVSSSLDAHWPWLLL